MRRRRWLGTGVIEEFDERQQRWLDTVLEAVQVYYRDLYGTRACHQHPLNLSRLVQLTGGSGLRVLNALRVLANSVDINDERGAPIGLHREQGLKNGSHRPYQIVLR